MIRAVFNLHILSLLVGTFVTLLVTVSVASANCRVIHLLDQIQASQNRLMLTPNTPSFQSDIRLIRRYANLLNDEMVLTAFDAYAFSPKGLTALRYSDYVQDLLLRTSIDDRETAQRHFRNPLVRRNIQNMAHYLDGLRCSAIELSSSQLPAPAQEDFGQELRQNIKQRLDWSIAVKGLAGILGVMLIGKCRGIWLARNRRKKMREQLRYETSCKVEDALFACVLSDINNTGAKLSRDALTTLTIGTKIGLQINGQWVEAQVNWANGPLSGVQFAQRLDKKLLQAVQRHGIDAAQNPSIAIT